MATKTTTPPAPLTRAVEPPDDQQERARLGARALIAIEAMRLAAIAFLEEVPTEMTVRRLEDAVELLKLHHRCSARFEREMAAERADDERLRTEAARAQAIASMN